MSSPSLVELKAILRLAGPLIAAQLAYVAMVFTDTVMMGKLGPDALAAGGLGAVSYAFVSTFCVGVVAAVGNLVAIRHGCDDAATLAFEWKTARLLPKATASETSALNCRAAGRGAPSVRRCPGNAPVPPAAAAD
ncbi:hypothetical protein ACS96_25965 [Pseudomonas aeruginosa]|nr:hypothetical protein ACS96_25965 [Pseudomonas aeruginosa]